MPTRKVSLPNSLAFLRPPLACLKYRLDPAPGLLPAAHFLRLPQAWSSAGGRRCNQVMLRTSCRPGSAPARSGWPPPRGCWPGDLSDPSWRCLTVANLKRFGIETKAKYCRMHTKKPLSQPWFEIEDTRQSSDLELGLVCQHFAKVQIITGSAMFKWIK